jgi:hypothetical protein
MEKIRQDLDETMTAVRALDGAIHYMSQRVAWNETCFQQVQDSGVMHMAEMIRKVMDDHKKLQGQFNMLVLRLNSQGGDGDSGGFPPGTVHKPSTNKFGS